MGNDQRQASPLNDSAAILRSRARSYTAGLVLSHRPPENARSAALSRFVEAGPAAQ